MNPATIKSICSRHDSYASCIHTAKTRAHVSLLFSITGGPEAPGGPAWAEIHFVLSRERLIRGLEGKSSTQGAAEGAGHVEGWGL